MADEGDKKGKVDVELATSLRTALRRPANKPMAFAVIAKDSSDGVLIVSKKKIPPAAIAEAKKKTKGKLLARGACHGQEGQLVFTTAKKSPATLVKTIKSIAKKYARVTVKPLVKLAGDTENENQQEPDDKKSTEKSKKKDGLDVKFKQVLRSIKPKLLKALNRDSGERDLMYTLYNNLSVRADKKDWEGGLDDLKTLEKLIPDALASSESREILPVEVEYKRTLSRLKPQMLRAIKARQMHPNAVRLRWRSAETHARKGDFESGLQSLYDLEEIMNQAAEPPRQPKKKAPKLTRMQSAARKLVVKWNVAKANAKKQIARVQAAMRKEAPEVAEKAEVYNDALHNYSSDLGSYLKSAAQTEDPQQSKAAYEKALERVEQQKERVSEDPVLKMLDYNTFVTVTIVKDLTQPLNELAQVLGALAKGD